MNQAAQATAVADIVVVGSALGAYPGAEIVGVIHTLTQDSEPASGPIPSLTPGQIVLVPRLLCCGECDCCRRGRVAACPQRTTRPRRPQPTERLPVRFLLPLSPPFCSSPPPTGDLFRWAALSDGLLAPYAALVRAGLGPGTLCAVLGRGARAALAAVVARAMGATTVLVSPGLHVSDRDRLLSPPFEALQVLSDEGLNAAATRAFLRDVAQQAGLPPQGFCILEASGSDGGRAYALSLLERGGTAVLLDRAQPLAPEGTSPRSRDLDPHMAFELPVGPAVGGLALLDRAVAEGCQIIGGGSVHPDLLVELVVLCERARIDLRSLTRRIEPTDVDATMAARRQGQGDALLLPIVDYGLASAQPMADDAPAAREP